MSYKPSGEQPGDSKSGITFLIFVIALFIVLIMLEHMHTKKRCGVASDRHVPDR